MPRTKGIRLTPTEEQAIIRMYQQGQSTTKIQQKLSCGAGTIYNVLARNSIPKREKAAEYGKCKTRDYFATIDTEAKAYFLGLLIADGSASGNTRITITLQYADKDILEVFANKLGMTTDEVKQQKARGSSGPQARLRFSSLSMREDLAKYGFVPNKVHQTFLPTIPSHLNSHLVRGIFDGDGHVSKYIVYISGTERLCKEIQQELTKANVSTYLYQQSDTGVWYLKGEAKAGRIGMLRYLYRDATIFLHRKKAIADATHLNEAPLQCEQQGKLRELLENPEEGNQQPSLGGDPSEGSTTSSNGLSETMKDQERGAPTYYWFPREQLLMPQDIFEDILNWNQEKSGDDIV